MAFLTLLGQVTLAQKESIWSKIDTIQQFPNKTLVEYQTYVDSILKEKAQAFFYPIVKDCPKYRFLGNIFTTEVLVDSIVFHGKRTVYLDNGYFKTENFEYGCLIATSYFDPSKNQISAPEFQEGNNTVGLCGIKTGNYFYHEKRRGK